MSISYRCSVSLDFFQPHNQLANNHIFCFGMTLSCAACMPRPHLILWRHIVLRLLFLNGTERLQAA